MHSWKDTDMYIVEGNYNVLILFNIFSNFTVHSLEHMLLEPNRRPTKYASINLYLLKDDGVYQHIFYTTNTCTQKSCLNSDIEYGLQF